MINLLNSHSFISSDIEILKQALMFVGKLYMFTQQVPETELLKFYDRNLLTKVSNHVEDNNNFIKLKDEYLRFLARVATTPRLQLAYFQLFFDQFGNDQAYLLDVYMWGYSRILLWYSNYNYGQYNDYQAHTKAIISRLMSMPFFISRTLILRSQRDEQERNYQYKQNSLLALIYLFSFRGVNQKFLHKRSEDFIHARKLIDLFEQRNERIILKAVSENKTLSQIFSEFINEVETSEDKINLLQRIE
ncbi:hypothetical protein [Synechococcus sp. PCC 7502]|uniref:hypothetical protein n=1 Tax=Synechococcus sp. PCC 7502 TaxID=1173263 RepID=UPI00059DFF64|nr:hypothetical protein [Synechococcus sp. PCC 7502]